MSLEVLEYELIAGKPVFKAISPGWPKVFAGDVGAIVRSAMRGVKWGRRYSQWRNGKSAAQITGEAAATKTIAFVAKPVSTLQVQGLQHLASVRRDPGRRNGIGGRSWIGGPARKEMVIVFHHANKAGPHIDVHLGHLSVVYRVKPELAAQLKYNKDGYLTIASQDLLLGHLRSEIANGSRVAQNLDHSLTNGKAQWVNGGTDGTAYGSGPTRQIISTSEVEIIKAGTGRPIEFYAPVLNPYRCMYLYRIYPGSRGHSPILIWGNMTAGPPKLEDRLHLKLVQPDDLSHAAARLDMATSTAKYDGSSTYFVITPKGTTCWSPRQSVVTGEQIEYTPKLDGIATVTASQTVIGMGEVLFRERTWKSWKKDQYLPCATGGGILNSNAVLPPNVVPEIRIYRIDRVGRLNTKDLGFWENRELQEQVARLDPRHFKVVELMSPETAHARGYEGVVIAPPLMSVNDATKVKWWQDAADWRIDTVNFTPGDKGGIAGTIACTSLESGKAFKLGPGQVGDRATCEQMMANPDQFVGSVLKVMSRPGHEGRASKAMGHHDDKGYAVY